MSSKKRVNKTFEESCRIDQLFIEQTNGIHWCISKETPKSRKFDKTVCQLLSCPNYISKEIESLSKKEKKIRGYIEKGKSMDFIMKNAPCSRTWYFEVKKRMEEDKKILEKEQIELDEESKTSQKIEEPVKKIHIKKPLSVSVEKTRVQARNRPKPKGLKPRNIKLMLNEYKDYRTAIRHALDKHTKYNIKEVREYLKGLKEKLYSSPEYLRKIELIESFRTIPTYETSRYLDMLNRIHTALKNGDVKTAKDIGYRLSELLVMITKKQLVEVRGQFSIIKDDLFYVPIWIKHFEDILVLKQMSRKEIRNADLTTKEWYEKMEIEFPEPLQPEANDVIENEADLIRTGIWGDLEHRIKEKLRIDNERERYYYTTEKLNSFDIFHINDLIREDPNDPYSIMLKEKLQDYENRGI